MKKIIITIIISLLNIFLLGCDNTLYHWQFRKSFSEVQKISIIYIETEIGAYEYVNIPPIKIIESSQYETFYEEIQNMEMTKKFRVELDHPSKYCFLIEYSNDDYCILSEFGSGFVYYDERFDILVFEYGKLDFNKDAFTALLNKYLEN